MADQASERNGSTRSGAAGLGLVVGLGAALVIDLERLLGPPTLAEYLAGAVDPLPSRLVETAAPVASALVALLLVLLLWQRGAWVGGFAVAAACALAAGGMGLVRARSPLPDEVPQWAVPVLVGLASAGVAPLLRERGLASLAVVSLAVGASVVLARRAVIPQVVEARALAHAREAALREGRDRLVLGFAPEHSPAWRRALVLSLWPPFLEPGVKSLGVDAGGEGEAALAAAGWPGLRVDAGAAVAPATRPDPSVLGTLEGGAVPAEVRVPLSGAAARVQVLVCTPVGVSASEAGAPSRELVLDPAHRAALAEAMGSLPRGMSWLVIVRARP
ncbi:MAG: hypothetical protein IT458_10445 [Planctomycetes bacterium]|nr:hypothetical protein [Planctomycetota bacterium]